MRERPIAAYDALPLPSKLAAIQSEAAAARTQDEYTAAGERAIRLLPQIMQALAASACAVSDEDVDRALIAARAADDQPFFITGIGRTSMRAAIEADRKRRSVPPGDGEPAAEVKQATDGHIYLDWDVEALRDRIGAELYTAPPAAKAVPMLLYCPMCGSQHIDAPDAGIAPGQTTGWDNPPHRSHLCHSCGCVWRPADVATVGVAAIETKGLADTFDASKGRELPRDDAQAVPDDMPVDLDTLIIRYGNARYDAGRGVDFARRAEHENLAAELYAEIAARLAAAPTGED